MELYQSLKINCQANYIELMFWVSVVITGTSQTGQLCVIESV